MLLNLDGDILIFIQEHIRNGVLDHFFPYITRLGDAGIFWIILTFVLLCFKKTRKAGIYSALGLIGSLLVNNMILKPLVARTRPYDCQELIDRGLILIGKAEHDYSFPSGHTAASFASAVSMYRYLPKKWMSISAIVLATLIALSRLYIGVHYPTDVLGGFISGLVIGIAVNLIADAVVRKMAEKKARKEEGEQA